MALSNYPISIRHNIQRLCDRRRFVGRFSQLLSFVPSSELNVIVKIIVESFPKNMFRQFIKNAYVELKI